MGPLESIISEFQNGGQGGVHLFIHQQPPDEAELATLIASAGPQTVTAFTLPRTPAFEPLRLALQGCVLGEKERLQSRFPFLFASISALAQDMSEKVGFKTLTALWARKLIDSRKSVLPEVDLSLLKGEPKNSPLRDPDSVLDTLVSVARSKTCDGKRLVISYWDAHKDRSGTVELLAELFAVAAQHSTRSEVYSQHLDRYLFLLHTHDTAKSLPRILEMLEENDEEARCFIHKVDSTPQPLSAPASPVVVDAAVRDTLRTWNLVFGSWQGLGAEFLSEILTAQGLDAKLVIEQLLTSGILKPGLEVEGATLYDVVSIAEDDSLLLHQATAAFSECLERHGWLTEAFDLACQAELGTAKVLQLGFKVLRSALEQVMPHEVRRVIDVLMTRDLKEIPPDRMAELEGLTGRPLALKREELKVWNGAALDAVAQGLQSLGLTELPPMPAYLQGMFAAFACSLARSLEGAGRPLEVPSALSEAEPLVLLSTRNKKVKLFPLALVSPTKGRGAKGRKVLPSGTASELHVVTRADSIVAWVEAQGLIRLSVRDLPFTIDLYATAQTLTVAGESKVEALCPVFHDTRELLLIAEDGQGARLTDQYIPAEDGHFRSCAFPKGRPRWLLPLSPETVVACGTTQGRLLLFPAAELACWRPGQAKSICQLKDGEAVAAATCLHAGEVALTLTAKGYGKKAEPEKVWRLKKPGQAPTKAMGGSDVMATVEAVQSLGGELLILTGTGRMVRIANEMVPLKKTPDARGPRVIKVDGDDTVVCATSWPAGIGVDARVLVQTS